MILFFSGTGNSEYVAKSIASQTGFGIRDIFSDIREGDLNEIVSDTPTVIVSPTYAWRIPRIVDEWIRKTEFKGNKNAYFVLTCGGSIGNAGVFAEKLCWEKRLCFRGCASVLMPENYIALYKAPDEKESIAIIESAEKKITEIVKYIKDRKDLPKEKVNLLGKIESGIVNIVYYPAIVHAKKFYATQKCVSCGKCEKVCPLRNISLKSGRPLWGDRCTHCMACICKCPTEAIEYGKNSIGKRRYLCPKS